MKNLDSYKCKAKTVEDFLDIDVIAEAIEVQICFRIKRLIELRDLNEDVSTKDFVNSLYANDIVKVAIDHIKYVSLMLFRSQFRPNAHLPMDEFKCPKNKENMTNIWAIYGLNMLTKDSHDLY